MEQEDDSPQIELDLASMVEEDQGDIEIRLKDKTYLVSWDTDRIYVTGKGGVHLDVVSTKTCVTIK